MPLSATQKGLVPLKEMPHGLIRSGSDALLARMVCWYTLATATSAIEAISTKMPAAASHVTVNEAALVAASNAWSTLFQVRDSLLANSSAPGATATQVKEAYGEFIGVAIPERMSLAETDRLTATLERLKVPMRRLLVNMVVPTEAAESCAFCQARRQAQGDVLAEFARSFKHALYVAPQQPHEVRGREELRAHFAAWRRARAQTKGAKRQRSGNR